MSTLETLHDCLATVERVIIEAFTEKTREEARAARIEILEIIATVSAR